MEAIAQEQDWSMTNKIRKAIRKVCRGYANIAAIEGQPGVGKSYTIKQTLREEGVEPVVVSGYMSSAYLFRLLYENADKVIWLKDCTKLMEDVRSLNLLKNATETDGERLVVSYQYGHTADDLPKKFVFTGQIILDFNKVKTRNTMDWQAVLSRSEHVVCYVSNPEMIVRMRQIASTGWQRQVTEHLITLMPGALPGQINLRTQARAFKSYQFAKQYGEDWREEISNSVLNDVDPLRRKLLGIIGNQPIRVTEIKRRMLVHGEVSTIRTAERRIKDWIIAGVLEVMTEERRNPLVTLTAR